MKKLFLLLTILSLGALILLATIDLEPYLGNSDSEPEEISEQLSEQEQPLPEPQPIPLQSDTSNLQEKSADSESVIESMPPQYPDPPPPEPTLAIAATEPKSAPIASYEIPALKTSSVSSKSIASTEKTERMLQTKDEQKTEPKPAILVTKRKTTEALTALVDRKIVQVSGQKFPFSILLDTYDEKITAQKSISLYRKRGIEPYWVRVDLGQKGIKYRLFTGFFTQVADAQKYINQHKLTDKLVKKTEYSALIGVFDAKQPLARAYSKTLQADTIPYILGTDRGKFYLYVGAFYTSTGAKDQCKALTAQQLPCKPVKRSADL